MKKYRLLFLFFFLLSSNCFLLFSQTKKLSADSVRILLRTNLPDTTRIKYQLQLSGQLTFQQPQEALLIADSALKMAEKLNFLSGKGNAYKIISTCYFLIGNMDTAVFLQNKCIAIAEQTKNTELLAQGLNSLGNFYAMKGEFKKAIPFMERSIEVNKKIDGNDLEIAKSYGNLGQMMMDQGNYNKAMDYFIKAREICLEKGETDALGNLLMSISGIYYYQGFYDKAIKTTYEGMSIIEQSKNTHLIGNTYVTLATYFQANNQNDSAEYYYSKSYQVYEKSGNKQGMAIALSSMGVNECNKKNYKLAEEYLLKGLKYGEEVKYAKSIVACYENLGLIYFETGQAKKAIPFLEKAMQVAKESNHRSTLTKIMKSYALALEKTGKLKESIKAYQDYIVLKDSVIKDQNQKAISEMAERFESEKNEMEIKNLKAEKMLQTAELSRQTEEIRRQNIQKLSFAGGFLLMMLMVVIVLLGYKRKKKDNAIINRQKIEVEEKNREIVDSINYAKRLQEAILPPVKLVKECFPQSFVLYKPKDIVAGDFYWLERVQLSGSDQKTGTLNQLIMFAAADCTGHGVPGAMVSVVCSNALNRAVKEFGITAPGKILDKVRDLVIETFEKSESEVKDGMDVSLCVFNPSTNELRWSGANSPLWIVRKGMEEIEEFKPDKQPVGKMEIMKPFITHSVQLYREDTLFIFSDGYVDQFGGEKGKKLKASNLKKIMLSMGERPMEEQREVFNDYYENWKGKLEQIDDVCMIGIRI